VPCPPFLCNAHFFPGSEHSRTAFLPRKQRGESRCDKKVVRQTTLWNSRRNLRNRNFHMPENAHNSFFGAALFSSPLSKYPGISNAKYQLRQLCLSCPIMQNIMVSRGPQTPDELKRVTPSPTDRKTPIDL